MRKLFSILLVAAAAIGFVVVPAQRAVADDITTVEGVPITTSTSASTAPTSTSGATLAPGEIANGQARGLAQIRALLSSIITSAVALSEKVRPESDKFAFGLAVITLILGGVRFAATRDPIIAWATLLEEMAILGIFAALYVGYAKFAPGLYNWFAKLASMIDGTSNGSSSWGAISSGFYDAIMKAFQGASWTEYLKLLFAMGPLFFAWVFLSLAAIVFTYYSNVGQLQAAAGIVVGPIAFALGFSPFTRGYFKSWLDYMVSAGMYSVVASALTALVTTSVNTALSTALANGTSTAEAATYVMDLAIFVLLLSFEIPKMAGMFGGGANASGGFLIGKAARVASGGIIG